MLGGWEAGMLSPVTAESILYSFQTSRPSSLSPLEPWTLLCNVAQVFRPAKRSTSRTEVLRYIIKLAALGIGC